MAENVQNLKKETEIQEWESQKYSNKRNPNRHTPGHIKMPKPDKDTIKKKIISLMNIDRKILIKILENLILSYKKPIRNND